MKSEESPPTNNGKRVSSRNKTTTPPSGVGGGALLTTSTTTTTTTTTATASPPTTSVAHEHKAAAMGGIPSLQPPPVAAITTTTTTTTKKKGRRPKSPHPPPPPTNAVSKNETGGKEQQQQQKGVSSQEQQQQQQQQQSSSYQRLPSSQYDEEYAKFMKSILGDDQTICTFNTRVTKREDVNASSSSVVGSTFETLDDDDLSYRLTSDEEEEEDEEDDDDDDTQDDDGEDDNVDGVDGMMEVGENDMEYDKTTAVGGNPSSFGEYDDDGQQQDLFEVLIGEIEDLMEEDQQAAFMTSLAETSGKGGELLSDALVRWNGTGFKGGGASGGVAVRTVSKGQVGNTGAIMGTVQQRAITTPGISTKKKKSTTTVINTPPPLSLASGGVGRTIDGDDSTFPGGGAIEVPAVRREQLARLRSIMARHHQLLLQQATLVVRASYVQKVRNVTVNGTLTKAISMSTVKKEDNTTLPTSRLDSKSLTFSINPLVGSGCSYANDFFGGETPEELTESLDGSTAMLQDLERNWKDAVRISIQQNEVSSQIDMKEFENGCSRRLTRSAFTKTLLERELEMDNQLPPSPVKQCPSLLPPALNSANRSSVFDVRGLSRLKESFSVLDHSVKDVQMGRDKGIKTLINILSSESVSTSLFVLGECITLSFFRNNF